MGFYPQPNAWQCGPFALKHGLLALGVVAHERALTRASGATPAGADERALARAATRWGCELPTVRRLSAARARATLAECLRLRQPVLVCIEQWSHWVTVVARDADAGGFVVLDSREPTVFRVMPWDQLGPALAYRTRRGRLYDLHPLVPCRRPPAWASFSARRAAYLKRAANRDLAYGWTGYLRSLLALSRPWSPQPELAIPLAEVIRGQERALRRVAQCRDPGIERTARRRLIHAGFVAETYDLHVAPDGEFLAQAALAALTGIPGAPAAMAG